MAITIPSLDETIAGVVAFFRNRLPDRDHGREAFLGKTERALAMTVYLVLKSIEDADKDLPPSEDSSSEALDKWAFTIGLASNLGSYGRNGAVAATGGVGTITGTPATVVPDGTILLGEDGSTEFQLDGDATIGGGGTVSADLIAVTKGTVGNVEADTVLTFQTTPSGVQASVTVTTDFSGGEDVESDAALLARILARYQDPPKGGTAGDYRLWAEDVEDVDRCYVYPRRNGTGTVDIVITQAGSGTSRVPGASTQTAVEQAIDTGDDPLRPVTVESMRVLLPYTTGGGKAIRVQIEAASDEYEPDWIDSAATYTVNATGGTATAPTIQLNTLAPATLKDAIDTYLAGNGDAPRLQVIATGGSAVPVLIRAIDWTDGGGMTTLTLEDPTADDFEGEWTTPTNGDVVYAGSNAVALIAGDILDYIDGLGPSRAGGYANELDDWSDTIKIAELIRIVLDVRDDDGSRVVSNVLYSGTTPLVTIAGATADVQASDTGGNPPGLLYATSICITGV